MLLHPFGPRFYLDADKGAGGGGDTPAESPETPTPTDGGAGDQTKTFTQAEVDALIQQRLERAKTSTTKSLLEQLGVEDPDEAKALLADARKLKQEQMSELEKAQAEADRLKKQLDDAKTAKEQEVAAMQQRLKRSAIIAEATRQGFNDPADAWLYVDKDAVKLDDNGDVTDAEKLVKAVAESKPYLVKAEGPGKGTPRTGKQPAQQPPPDEAGQRRSALPISF